MRGNDQIVCAGGCSGLAGVGDQAGVVGDRGLGVVEHLDHGGDGGERPGAVGGPFRGVRKLDADLVFGNGHCRYGQFVIVERGAVDGPALVGDEDIGVEDQASAHGSLSSVVSSAIALLMSWAARYPPMPRADRCQYAYARV
jgi:hypothetical protein